MQDHNTIVNDQRLTSEISYNSKEDPNKNDISRTRNSITQLEHAEW